MLISMDPDCPPYCRVCAAQVHNLVSLNRRNIVSESASTKRAIWPLYILLASIAFLGAAGVLQSFFPASAIFGQGHQFHETTGDLTVAEGLGIIESSSKDIRLSSIDLTERLEVIEFLSKKIHLSLTESAYMTVAKEVDTTRMEFPGSSISPCDSSQPPSSSDLIRYLYRNSDLLNDLATL